jgi:hypothetical protein
MRNLTILVVSVLFVLTSALRAQEMSEADFQKAWKQGVDLEDEKVMDRAVKQGSRHVIQHFESLALQARSGTDAVAERQCELLMASWKRNFENTDTLEKVQRWADGATTQLYNKLQQIRTTSGRLWNDYTSKVATGTIKKDYQSCMEDYQKLARAAESIGHYYEASELWGLASVVGSKMPEKTLEDREAVVFAIEQQLLNRDNWGYTFDTHYARNKGFVESEIEAIKEARKKADKRKDEGYDANAKGIDALVMPNVPAKKYELKFAPLKDWSKDLDYGPRGGPVPAFWWLDSLRENGSSQQMGWFTAQPMYLIRRGTNKFAVHFKPTDEKDAIEISANSRAKPSTFYLDAEQKRPYSMFFWVGTDQEATGITKLNYAPTSKFVNVYYRSASSWKTTIEKESITYYDDDASGTPGNGEPFKGELKSHLVGDPNGDGALVPLFDSMEVGKGDRVPYSKFLKLADGWHYQEIATGFDVSVRKLNPEYVKSGNVKLSWKGSKSARPDQIVIQGKGDYAGAIFEIAGGKPVEVPAGEYRVIWGRIVNGKGARVQTAQLYPSADSESFLVKAGETFTLEMGEPFVLDFERKGDQTATIDALSICVKEKSGCRIVGVHGTSLDCEVLASKTGTSKGAKSVGSFVPFTNDQLIVKATEQYRNLGFLVACSPMPKGYKEGELVLEMKLPEDGMKLGLAVKKGKHKFFGKLGTVWK